jgi:hypothetical protein
VLKGRWERGRGGVRHQPHDGVPGDRVHGGGLAAVRLGAFGARRAHIPACAPVGPSRPTCLTCPCRLPLPLPCCPPGRAPPRATGSSTCPPSIPQTASLSSARGADEGRARAWMLAPAARVARRGRRGAPPRASAARPPRSHGRPPSPLHPAPRPRGFTPLVAAPRGPPHLQRARCAARAPPRGAAGAAPPLVPLSASPSPPSSRRMGLLPSHPCRRRDGARRGPPPLFDRF